MEMAWNVIAVKIWTGEIDEAYLNICHEKVGGEIVIGLQLCVFGKVIAEWKRTLSSQDWANNFELYQSSPDMTAILLFWA